jgi:hypothetical protein
MESRAAAGEESYFAGACAAGGGVAALSGRGETGKGVTSPSPSRLALRRPKTGGFMV